MGVTGSMMAVAKSRYYLWANELDGVRKQLGRCENILGNDISLR